MMKPKAIIKRRIRPTIGGAIKHSEAMIGIVLA
jgi:hypothetical protein